LAVVTDGSTIESVVTAGLASRLRLAIARLHRQLRQQSGTGLTLSQQSALATIEMHGPISLSEVAAIEQVAPPTVTKILGKLEEDGLVDRSVDPLDGRVTLVSCSREGRRRLEESRSRRAAWLAVRLAELAPDELERLLAATDVLEVLARPEEPR
jgi:DNA-binding MarR family transcriptional regulator